MLLARPWGSSHLSTVCTPQQVVTACPSSPGRRAALSAPMRPGPMQACTWGRLRHRLIGSEVRLHDHHQPGAGLQTTRPSAHSGDLLPTLSPFPERNQSEHAAPTSTGLHWPQDAGYQQDSVDLHASKCRSSFLVNDPRDLLANLAKVETLLPRPGLWPGDRTPIQRPGPGPNRSIRTPPVTVPCEPYPPPLGERAYTGLHCASRH